MTRVMVFVLVSIAVMTTIAVVSVRLSHAQIMRENSSFIGSMEGHMSQVDGSPASDMWTPHECNATHVWKYLDQCENMHEAMNVTGHMMGMR